MAQYFTPEEYQRQLTLERQNALLGTPQRYPANVTGEFIPERNALAATAAQTIQSNPVSDFWFTGLGDYLQGMGYGTNPQEPPFTSWRSTGRYLGGASDLIDFFPAVPAAGRAVKTGAVKVGNTLLNTADSVLQDVLRNSTPMLRQRGAVGDLSRTSGTVLDATDPATTAAVRAEMAASGTRYITDADVRHEIARRNAVSMLGLPPGNTAADRANALGYTTDAYHGSKSNFDKVNFKYSGTGSGSNDTKNAFFSSNNPANASEYAFYSDGNDFYTGSSLRQLKKLEKKYSPSDFYVSNLRRHDPDLTHEIDRFLANNPLNKPKVYPLKINTKKNTAVDWSGGPWDEGFSESILRNARKKHTGVTNLNIRDWAYGEHGNPPVTTYVQFFPSTIRSRFAAFDPARINRPDILAGTAAATAGLPYLIEALRNPDTGGY